MSTISIAALDDAGSFTCHVAEPDGSTRGAIIVLQEVFGVNEGIRRKCERFAANGYTAFAPDLFWRIEPGIELDPDVESELKRGLELAGLFDQEAAVRDIEATIHAARAHVAGGKVGVVGYCMGGRLAYFAATRTDADASVGYYAVGIDGVLNEARAIANPLMLHIPTADHFVGPDAQAAMHDGLDDHPKVVLHDYAGLDHGFATEIGSRRNEEGAALADSRTDTFFAEHVG